MAVRANVSVTRGRGKDSPGQRAAAVRVAGEISGPARRAGRWRWGPPRGRAARAPPRPGPARGLAVVLEGLPGAHPPGRAGRVCPASPRGGAVSGRSENGAGLGAVSRAALGGVSSPRAYGAAELPLSGLAGRARAGAAQRERAAAGRFFPRARTGAAWLSRQSSAGCAKGCAVPPSVH